MNTEVEELQESEEQKLNLTVDVQETSACGRHVTVTVPREEVERYFSKQFDELVPKAELPGFRPGKAPRFLVEKKFRKQLTDQVKGQLIMDSLAQVNDSKNFSAISEPDLDYEQVKIPEEGDFTYEFNIEVRPEFEIPQYKELKLTRPERDFTDEDIDKQVKLLASSTDNAVLAPVEDAAQLDDLLICDVTVKHGGEVISTHEECQLQLRQIVDFPDARVEQFDQLMVGAKAGDTRNVTVELSEFADNEELRGKSVDVEIELLEVKRIEGQQDDELLESFNLDSMDTLRERIQSSLEQRLEYAQRQTIRDQISSKLTESAEWNLPTDLLERQANREVQRAVMEMQSSGFSQSEIVARENQLRKDAHQRTAILLKEHFILERIAEVEEIADEPMDYEIEIAKIAMQQQDSPRRVRSRLERSGQMDALRNMIIERKVIELITDSASFEGTAYEFNASDDTYHADFFLGGRKQSIPEAKYDGGEAAPIPGTEKDR